MVSIDFVAVYDFLIRLWEFLYTLMIASTSTLPRALNVLSVYFRDIGWEAISDFLGNLENLITAIVDTIGVIVPSFSNVYNNVTLIEAYLYICISVVVLLGFLKLLGDILPT